MSFVDILSEFGRTPTIRFVKPVTCPTCGQSVPQAYLGWLQPCGHLVGDDWIRDVLVAEEARRAPTESTPDPLKETAMSDTYARCTRIDLDDEAMPAMLTIVMTDDVLARIRRNFDLDASRRADRLIEAYLYVARAADMVRHLRWHSDAAAHAFCACVAGIVARFWPEGVEAAPTAGLIAKSATNAR